MRKDTERNQDPNSSKAKKIEVVEERLVVDKEKVETGKVVLHKRVIEEDVPLDLNLTEEHIDVEVKKIGDVVDKPGPAVREEGDTTIYSVYREVYVKQTILEEEVRITRKKMNRPYHSSEKLRREVIDVERISGQPQENDSAGKFQDERRKGERGYDEKREIYRQGDFQGYNVQGDVCGNDKLNE